MENAKCWECQYVDIGSICCKKGFRQSNKHENCNSFKSNKEKTMKEYNYEIIKDFTAADVIKVADDPNCRQLWNYIDKYLMIRGETHSVIKELTLFYVKKVYLNQIMDQAVYDFLIQHDFIKPIEPEIELIPGSVWLFESKHIRILIKNRGDLYFFVDKNHTRIIGADDIIGVPKKQIINIIKTKKYKLIANSYEEYLLKKGGGKAQ